MSLIWLITINSIQDSRTCITLTFTLLYVSSNHNGTRHFCEMICEKYSIDFLMRSNEHKYVMDQLLDLTINQEVFSQLGVFHSKCASGFIVVVPLVKRFFIHSLTGRRRSQLVISSNTYRVVIRVFTALVKFHFSSNVLVIDMHY